MNIVFWLTMGVLFGALATQHGKWTRAKRFSRRENMNINSLQKQFYSDIPIDVLVPIFKILEESLDVPVGKLRPTDRFDVELAATNTEVVDNRNDLLWQKTLQLYGARLPDEVLKHVNNIHEYVYRLAHVVGQDLDRAH